MFWLGSLALLREALEHHFISSWSIDGECALIVVTLPLKFVLGGIERKAHLCADLVMEGAEIEIAESAGFASSGLGVEICHGHDQGLFFSEEGCVNVNFNIIPVKILLWLYVWRHTIVRRKRWLLDSR